VSEVPDKDSVTSALTGRGPIMGAADLGPGAQLRRHRRTRPVSYRLSVQIAVQLPFADPTVKRLTADAEPLSKLRLLHATFGSLPRIALTASSRLPAIVTWHASAPIALAPDALIPASDERDCVLQSIVSRRATKLWRDAEPS
jgi:hypothetical protein